MLSEAVKADIHQAVSSTAGGSSLSKPWALLAVTAGKTELCDVPGAKMGVMERFGLESWVGSICSLFSVLSL